MVEGITGKMRRNRLKVVNKMIDDRIRPIKNLSGKNFYKCNICLTCKFFNIQTDECCLTYEDAVKKINLEDIREEYFFVPTPIKDPLYYRCLLWQDR